MEELFNKTCDFNQEAYRNIVSLRKSEHLFDDLTDDTEEMEIAVAAEMQVKQHIPQGKINRGFYYSAAINYPFEHEPYMVSRYSDGSFPVWYGSVNLKTTIYETAYHMMRTEMAIEGLNEIIIREREVFKVHCTAVLLDLTDKHHAYPQLIANEYEFTQLIGKRLAHEGHPGLLVPSARYLHRQGINTVIFNPEILTHPRSCCYLTYFFDIQQQSLTIERVPGKTYLKIKF